MPENKEIISISVYADYAMRARHYHLEFSSGTKHTAGKVGHTVGRVTEKTRQSAAQTAAATEGFIIER
jgi:hypothetical protein